MLLATGATAEVYTWEHHHILKLFNAGIPREIAEREANLTCLVSAKGVRVPAVIELVEIEGRAGIVYERINGNNMLDRLSRQPLKLLHFARLTAELHVDLHRRCIPDLPPMRQRLEAKINAADLSVFLKVAALKALKSMPDGESVCHGDLHPNNIMLTANGPVIIDWLDATLGDPLADVARTLIIAGEAARDLNIAKLIFRRVYLNHYLKLSGAAREAVFRWLPIIAAGRLDENVTGKDRLVKIVEKLI